MLAGGLEAHPCGGIRNGAAARSGRVTPARGDGEEIHASLSPRSAGRPAPRWPDQLDESTGAEATLRKTRSALAGSRYMRTPCATIMSGLWARWSIASAQSACCSSYAFLCTRNCTRFAVKRGWKEEGTGLQSEERPSALWFDGGPSSRGKPTLHSHPQMGGATVHLVIAQDRRLTSTQSVR